MKQLLYAFGCDRDDPDFLVAAIDTRAFLIHLGSQQWFELGNPDTTAATGTTRSGTEEDEQPHTSKRDKQPVSDATQSLLQVQAVTGCVIREGATGNKTIIYCAVARQSKQLCIYRLNDWKVDDAAALSTSASPISIFQPQTTHQAPKRVSSMMFTSSLRPAPVLVTGDLAGDVFAYSLTHGSTEITAKEAADEGQLRHRKLLLGHTASMLTDVAFCPSCNDTNTVLPRYILTADRDEKIRITHFPSTFDIHGFLFGHTAFVCCLSVLNNGLCLSCGGDYTLRVWNTESCKLLGTLDLQTEDQVGVPCDMCVSAEDRHENSNIRVAIIYDRSATLDLFKVSLSKENSGNVQFVKGPQIQLPGQPLGLSGAGSSFFILVQEPHFLQAYNWDGKTTNVPASVRECNTLAAKEGTRLPTAILERNHEDELKMVKNEETRGPAMLLPWNNSDRKDLAFRKRKRQRKSRKSRKERCGASEEEPSEEEPEEEEAAGEEGN